MARIIGRGVFKMGQRIRFGEPEIKVVKKELAQAEKLLSCYYCIPAWEWNRYPYEIRTQGDLKEEEGSADVLALVAKYGLPPPRDAAKKDPREFFGICLQDENIMKAASRDPANISFDALILYILTHELVHVFRFANQFEDYLIPSQMRGAEESRVHKITRHILEKHPDRTILPVLKLYEDPIH